ncbi:MAG: class SAM-dependent methyltransferase [Thermomicrobiales bacterium]|jgi:SAM-dependent methyltransferase|nr:class SAM-dependent methyltransferase [Thermomicrobiales bacterium]
MSMLPKPTHLDPEYAQQFGDPSVVAAYHHRPPYPPQVIDHLLSLVVAPGTVLDAGTGTGEIARALAERGVRVDALDPSAAMLERGRHCPSGDHLLLTWILGAAENAPLRPPYGLITTAASLHWMTWEIVLPRFRDLLAPGGVLAIVEQRQAPQPWDSALSQVVTRYSTNRFYQPYDLIAELKRRTLFDTLGQVQTDPVAFTQPIADYVESFHARNGFSRDRMSPQDAAAFDAEAERLVRPFAQDGQIALEITGLIVWGHPAPTTTPP